VDAVLRGVDALLVPIIGAPAPANAGMAQLRSDSAPWHQPVLRVTCPYDFSGHPAMTFPTRFTPRGTPLGAQVVGAHHSENLLLSLVEQYQRVTEHHLFRPVRYP